jgi:hypothetical protein
MLIVLSGCTQQNSSDETFSLEKHENKTNPPDIDSIQKILEKTESIESMYYEIDVSIYMSEFGTQTANIKIWQKNPYIKEQITSVIDDVTTTITVIQRPEGIYMYDDENGKYITATDEITSISTSLQYFDSEIIKNYIGNQPLTDFETDIIDGKKATIIQYSPLEIEYPMDIKLWISSEMGFPLKAYIDMEIEDMKMTMDFNFKNYSFLDIPNSTFSIS